MSANPPPAAPAAPPPSRAPREAASPHPHPLHRPSLTAPGRPGPLRARPRRAAPRTEAAAPPRARTPGARRRGRRHRPIAQPMASGRHARPAPRHPPRCRGNGPALDQQRRTRHLATGPPGQWGAALPSPRLPIGRREAAYLHTAIERRGRPAPARRAEGRDAARPRPAPAR